MVLTCEFLVIGGGTAGLRTALYAASHGHKTILVEPGAIGGTCLNFGCIPTKTLLESVHVYHSALNAGEFGVKTGKVTANFSAIMKRMKSIVADGQKHIKKSLKNSQNLTVIRKPAYFLSANTVQAGSEVISADKIVISTGSRSAMVPIPGLDKVPYLTSDDVLKLKKLPKSLLVVGGGYIAMELATFFNGLGCKVTILERLPRVIALLDEDITNTVTEYYTDEDIKIHTNVNIIGLRKEKNSIVAECNDVRDPNSKKVTYRGEQVLVSVGRSPNTDSLKLEAANIQIDKRKYIIVNDQLLTTNELVYAIGDVNGKGPFAHGAKVESKAVLENALNGASQTINYTLMPFAVFTDPPIAGVGLSEVQAKEKGIEFGIMKGEFRRAGRSTIIGDTRGYVKVIYDKKTNWIVGAFIIGPSADNLIHEFVALLNTHEPTLDVLNRTIHIHPTLAEVMEALKTVS